MIMASLSFIQRLAPGETVMNLQDPLYIRRRDHGSNVIPLAASYSFDSHNSTDNGVDNGIPGMYKRS